MLGGGKLEAILAELRSRWALCKVRNDAVCLGGIIYQYRGGGSIAEELGQARVSKPKRPIGRMMLNIDLPH